MLLDRLNTAQVPQAAELGGHSSVWALRAQQENCHVYASPTQNKFTIDQLVFDKTKKDLIHLPEIQFSEDSKQDLHLVFEYNAGDEILGYKAPRSNRLYFVHDPNGGFFH